MRTPLALALAAALAGCTQPSTRIAGELQRYGLDAGRAQCIGDRLQRNLSVSQLRELAAAAKAYGRDDATPGRLTTSDLTRVAASIHDPAVPIAVFRAGTACGITVADVLG